MSIFLLIGQCGNQLGEAVFDQLYYEIYQKKDPVAEKYENDFFYSNKGQEKIIANAISVDMEPKVIDSLISNSKNKPYLFSPYNSYNKQEGSGNNWAFGYYCHGPNCGEAILKKVDHLVHKFDRLKSIIIIQSMAGGTGSGVGSYLLTILKEEYPTTKFINFMVAPKKGGEVILQNYNAIFSLATIYEHSDFVFILENDRATEICQKILEMKKIEMDSINSILTKNIITSLLIDDKVKSSNRNFTDIYKKHLTPFPMGKLLGNRFLPHTKEKDKDFLTDNWFSLTKRAFQMQICGSSETDINWSKSIKSKDIIKSMGTYLELNSTQFPIDEKMLEKPDFFFKSDQGYHKGVGDNRFKLVYHKREMFGLSYSCTLLTNSQEYVPLLEYTFEKATEMYGVGAYVFQYENFGLDQETMIDKFHYFQNIIDYYKDF